MEAALARNQVHEALAAIASPGGPPAAGVASALTAAAAASLVELASALAAERMGPERADAATRMRGLSREAAELRERLLAAADEDVAAYSEVANAADPDARAAALAGATKPPQLIGECASKVAEAAAEVAAASEAWDFRADAVVAGELAAAAARSSAELVAANRAAASPARG